MRAVSLAILLAVHGCCEPPRAPEVTREAEAAPGLWRVKAKQVREVDAIVGTQRITVTRDDADPTRAWCRIATEDGRAPIEFPVEGQAARELFEAVAAPRIRRELTESERDDLDFDDTHRLVVSVEGGAQHRLSVAESSASDTERAVLDPENDHAYVVADPWWRTLTAAQRVLPLRKLVERRGLEHVTLHADGRAWSFSLRGAAWVPDEGGIDRGRAHGIVSDALRLRPGTFDRALDPSTLREVARFEFTGGERPQALGLFAGEGDAYFVASTRAEGIATVHHIDAMALADAIAALD